MKTLDELSKPNTVTRKILEKDVQKKCVDWARARGYWARKFSSQSQRSVPDYLFSHPGNLWDTDLKTRIVTIKFAVEFKRPGTPKKYHQRYDVWQMSTEAQVEEQVAMRGAGWYVFECDDFEEFKATVLEHEKDIHEPSFR